jgi:enoyl-CoA hydratase/carnithine racemase
MAYQTILFDRSEGVGMVTLNRPDQLNAFTPQMLQELLDVFRGMERDPEVRAILITGAGKAFCGGEDFRSRAESEVAVQPPPQSTNFYNNTPQSVQSNPYSVESVPNYSPLNPGPPPSINSNIEEAPSPFDSPFNPRSVSNPGPVPPPPPAPGTGSGIYQVPASAPQPVNIARPASLVEQLRRAYNPLIRQIRKVEKPVIAAVNGVAAGTGLGLALACDIRYASDRARFVEVAVRVGLLPGGGNGFFLPRLIGVSRAMELIFSGDELSAQEAERYGLVSKVVTGDQLLDQSRKLAVRLAKGPTRAIGLSKALIYNSANLNLDQALDLEAQLAEDASRSEDYKEGLRAFLEKRPPKYRGA